MGSCCILANLFIRAVFGIEHLPVSENRSGFLLEAIARLLTIPDGSGQGELAADAILANSTERPPPEFFRLDIVRLEPQCLQLGVVVGRKLMTFQYPVKFLKVSPMKRNDGFCLEHTFIFMELITRG